MKRGQAQSGFTIVELLIVIVVIGILATITVIAFGSMQTKGRNTQVVSGAAAYNKAVMQYIAENGSLPSPSGCLGANYPSNQCWVGTNGTTSVNSTLDSQLAKYLPGKPTLATTLLAMDANNNRGGLMYLFDYPAAGQAELRFYLNGNGTACSAAGFVAMNEGSLTNCYKRF